MAQSSGTEFNGTKSSGAQPGDGQSLTISLVQMDCELGRPKENFERAGAWVAEASRRGSQLVVLPELWSTAYDLENAAVYASSLGGRGRAGNWFSRFAKLAKAQRVWLTGSILEVQADGCFYNCMPLYAPDGALKGVYRKVHLFSLMDEDRYLAPGQGATLLDLPWGKTGLAICYDLRFPELFRRYAVYGARLVILPAEWPCVRREHWRTLLRARAIENQCFVAGCNRVGISKGTDFCGLSAVADPWGDVLVEGGDGEELLTVTVDLALADEARQTMPVLTDRRPELY